MRKELIESYVTKLWASFGGLKPPIEDDELLLLYRRKDYAGMVSCVRRVFGLEVRITLGLVNHGGQDMSAWIDRPDPLPMFGSADLRRTTVVLYLRRSFLYEMPFESVVFSIAHELSHVVLDALWHELRREEEAVDLAAMLLGFRDFFVTGCRNSREFYDRRETTRLGYLTQEEILYASQFMTFKL